MNSPSHRPTNSARRRCLGALGMAAALATGLGLVSGSTGCAIEPASQTSDATETGIDPRSCPGGAPHLVNGRPASWTILHYAAADNNLERVIVGDLDEMELGHQGSPNVNVLVQLDRRSETGRWRYRIEPDSTAETIASPVVEFSEEEPDSGDWRTLSEYGRWGVTCYPAENYAVVIGGHGGGWSSSDDRSASMSERARHQRARRSGESARTIAPDDTNGSEMYVDQLATALGEISRAARRSDDPDYLNRLVLYGSDACLMETFEVAYELRNAVTYLVGSEETEPAAGWPYNTLVRELTQRPSYYAVRPHLLAAMIVEVYGRSYGPGGSAPDNEKITLAAVDTSAMIRARNRVDRIATLLVELLAIDPSILPIVLSAREGSYDFGDDYADLGRFVDNLGQGLLAAGKVPAPGAVWDGDERWRTLRNVMDELLQDVWSDLVVASVAGNFEGARGLSIFFPTDSCGWGMDLDDYAKASLAADSSWDELLRAIVAARGAGDYRDAYGSGTMSYDAVGQTFEATANCNLHDGRLNVYIMTWSSSCEEEDDGCIDRLDLNFELDVAAQTVVGANMVCSDLGVQSEITDVSLPLTPTEGAWDPGLLYEGTFDVSFPTPDGETPTLDARVRFRCESFRDRNCWHNW